jgi:hypothetical protein
MQTMMAERPDDDQLSACTGLDWPATATDGAAMLLDDVERIIRETPGLTGTQIARTLYGPGGYAEQINHSCLALARVGRIERRGRGGPGDPFTYHPLDHE